MSATLNPGGAPGGGRNAVGRVFVVGLCILSLLAPSVASAQSIYGNYNQSAYGPADAQSAAAQQAAQPTPPDQTANNPPPAASQPIEPVNISAGSGNSATTALAPASGASQDTSRATTELLDARGPLLKPPAKPNEFQTWVDKVTGRKIKRFGTDLLVPSNRDFAVPATTTIPPDYALNVGDTVTVSLSGSVEGSSDFRIDRDGQIYIPGVGSVNLVGVHYRDLKERIAAALGTKYRKYQLSVSISKLRGIRVYVTGFANNPGAFTVNSLSTLVNAVLAAGGPSSGGSFRSVKLYRNGREVVDFDLYQLLRKGDRSRDPLLQNEDVLFIPPVGAQVAVVGSVNDEAIYEMRPGESVEDALRFAGGPTNLADQNRLILYRLKDQDTVGSREIDDRQAAIERAEPGDIIQILAQGTLARPIEKQQVVVRVEGEVARPGNYYVAPGTTLPDVIRMAGGLTPRAYVFGAEFTRESVRAEQRARFTEAIAQMESVLAAQPLNSNVLIDAGERQTQLASARAYLNRLRLQEPDGRLVLDLTPRSIHFPDIIVENNDHIQIPARVETVGVFGAVYRPASFFLDEAKPRRIRDYVDEAGGTVRGADKGHIFVVRANGSVLTRKDGALNATPLPGDAIFVPIRAESNSLWSKLLGVTAIASGAAITIAALKAVL